VSVNRQQYKKVDYLTAVLLKIQVLWDVTLCCYGYTDRITSHNVTLCCCGYSDRITSHTVTLCCFGYSDRITSHNVTLCCFG
jgi:hypothetical protein